MTEITPGEIKLIYLQIVMMAIIGIFVFLYSSQPINQDVSVNSNINNASTNVNSKDASWITNLMSNDAGLSQFLPNGLSDILIVSAVFLIPLTIMNLITAIRFIKDISTQWI